MLGFPTLGPSFSLLSDPQPMRRIQFTTEEDLPHAETLLFPLPFDTPEQRVVEHPDLPRIKAINAAQEAMVVPIGTDGKARLTLAFEDGYAPFPAGIWSATGGPHETPSPELVSLITTIAPAGLDPADRVARIVSHVAERFTYGIRPVGLADDRGDMPALSCGLYEGTCVDTHSYAVACLRAAGIRAAYIGGVWFPAQETSALSGHCWLAVDAEGALHHWDISHFLKFEVPGPVRPLLNPAGGQRQALGCGRDLVFAGATFSRLSGFATPDGKPVRTVATILSDIRPFWARPLRQKVDRLSTTTLDTRRHWHDGPVTHAAAHAAAPVLAEVETGGTPIADSATGSLRLFAWNVERLRFLDPIAATIRADGADVSLLSEIDKGMARSGNSDRIADLARLNGQTWAYGVEFIELGRGDAEERAATEGVENALGYHGNAIMSGLTIHRPAILRLEADGVWFNKARGQPRVGGRIALAAQILLDGCPVTVVSVHLESHSDPQMRAAQMRRLIELIDDYDSGAPVVIGGDLNTSTVDRRVTRCEDTSRVVRVIPWEPLFHLAASHGYAWDGCNVPEMPTQRLLPGQMPYALGKIDWFLTRGLLASRPTVVPATDAQGQPVSDHEAIAVTLKLP